MKEYLKGLGLLFLLGFIVYVAGCIAETIGSIISIKVLMGIFCTIGIIAVIYLIIKGDE